MPVPDACDAEHAGITAHQREDHDSNQCSRALRNMFTPPGYHPGR